jgi:hypothetical protein
MRSLVQTNLSPPCRPNLVCAFAAIVHKNMGHNVLIFAYDKANRLEDRQV